MPSRPRATSAVCFSLLDHGLDSVQCQDQGNPAWQPNNALVLTSPVPTGRSAYQTAVAWSAQDSRWLVAWTENAYPSLANGAVYTAYVNFDVRLQQEFSMTRIDLLLTSPQLT